MIRTLHTVVAALLLLSLTPISLSAQCPSGDVSLYSQADVNAFVSTYPGCTAITGDLYIGAEPGIATSTDINDLSGLSVQSITGSLNLDSNPLLTSLAGLGSLNTIMGRLDITNNDGLSNIDLFNGLFVGLHITVSENDGLSTISGMNGIGTMRRISIFNNSSLMNITGLANIDVFLDLTIQNNPVLTNISGFTYFDLGGLSILDNASLAICNVAGVCDALLDGSVVTNISGNASGCDTEPVVMAACLGGLPVELTEFVISKRGLSHDLFWATASERNNMGFSIEHSMNGSNWQSIGFVDGHGDSNQRNEYRFAHNDAGAGLHYYRLQQLDNNGAFEYSPIRQSLLGIAQKDNSIRAFPNPSKGLFNVVINNPNGQKGKLTIASLQGQKIYETNFADGSVSENWTKQFSDLAPGFYVIKLQLGQSVTWEKVQVIDNK